MEDTDNAAVSPVDLELKAQSQLAEGYEKKRDENKQKLKELQRNLALENAKEGIHFAPEKSLRLYQIEKTLDSDQDLLRVSDPLLDDPMKDMPGIEGDKLPLADRKKLLGFYKDALAKLTATFAPTNILTGIEILEQQIAAEEQQQKQTASAELPATNQAEFSEPANPLADQTDRTLKAQELVTKGYERQREENKTKLEALNKKLFLEKTTAAVNFGSTETSYEAHIFAPEKALRMKQIDKALKGDTMFVPNELFDNPLKNTPSEGQSTLSLEDKQTLLDLYNEAAKQLRFADAPAIREVNRILLQRELTFYKQHADAQYVPPTPQEILKLKLEVIERQKREFSPIGLLDPFLVPKFIRDDYRKTKTALKK